MSLVLLVGFSLPCRAQDNSIPPTEQHQQQTSESSQHRDDHAPEPHPELKPLVDAIPNLLNERKYDDALQQADALLQQASEKGDKTGQAYAHRFRAWALQGLNRLEEAVSAWRQARGLWQELGDGVFETEALLGWAFCLWRTDRAQAEGLIDQALDLAQAERRRPLAMAQVLSDSGAAWYGLADLSISKRCFEQVLAIQNRFAPHSVGMALTLNNLGNIAADRGDLAAAQQYYEQAFAIQERLAPNSREAAVILNGLGSTALYQGNLEAAQRYFERALAIFESIAPNSLEIAAILNSLGVVAYNRGDLSRAQQYYEQALGIYERLVPNSLAAAQTLNNLGLVAYNRGNLEEALRYFERSLALKERLAPNSLSVAQTLNNLGNVARHQGDLATAQQRYEQALGIYERLAPNSLSVAQTLNNLGIVARQRGDLALAQGYYERALAIQERLAPNSLSVAQTLNNLGIVARQRGDLATAQQRYEQALGIYERIAPGSLREAAVLHNLGNVAIAQGDLERAQQYYERALTIRERLAPQSLEVADTLHNLGNVAFSRGDMEQAQQYLEQSLAIVERFAPNALEAAHTHYVLAQLKLLQNQPQAAILHLQRALAITETQRQAVADPESRALFSERYFSPYPILARAHLQLNQPARAAETLERSRARSLAETLQQRQLAFAENTPPALRQLLRQQDQLNAKRLQTYRQLQETRSDDAETIAQLQRTLRELDQQQRVLNDRLRKEFPDYASLALPKPLTIQQIQQSLDAGTVLLYHALTEDHLLIIAVSRTEVRGVARRVDVAHLEKQVQQLRAVLSKPPVFRNVLERREWQQQSQWLYAELVAPMQGMLKNAQRVLLCPDGVLCQLPWAALIVKTENGKPVYWIERTALHLTPSVGVYRQARAVQPASQGAAIAAVWNYTNGKPIDLAQHQRLEAATLLRRSGAGTVLEDLPHGSKETAALRKLFGKEARVAVNTQATPQQARRLTANARVVHFVCHARVDHTDPLSSALLLAPAGSDVGKLTAGEVLLNWRLRADLVMLSACETGVGMAKRYEGVYSLGRAFLAAGSRSVGMSLWKVSDEATVKLMEGFYRRYVRGTAKDEALRAAQLGLLRTPKYADPYFWSAFVLMGDYR